MHAIYFVGKWRVLMYVHVASDYCSIIQSSRFVHVCMTVSRNVHIIPYNF